MERQEFKKGAYVEIKCFMYVMLDNHIVGIVKIFRQTKT